VVVGAAGLLVDPDRPGELAAAIARLLDDPALAAACSGKGVARAARFTWERTARATRSVYDEVLVRRGPAG
jgi:alpha-1,3-rhamnosyl/mannosyltransferase